MIADEISVLHAYSEPGGILSQFSQDLGSGYNIWLPNRPRGHPFLPQTAIGLPGSKGKIACMMEDYRNVGFS
jgi:hypothetical protein